MILLSPMKERIPPSPTQNQIGISISINYGKSTRAITKVLLHSFKTVNCLISTFSIFFWSTFIMCNAHIRAISINISTNILSKAVDW